METMIEAKIIETREKGYDGTYWRVVCESGVIEGEYTTLAGAEEDCSEWGYSYEIIPEQIKVVVNHVFNFIKVQGIAIDSKEVEHFINNLSELYRVEKK